MTETTTETIRVGTDRSFEGFFAEEHPRLFGSMCIATRDRHEAEEVVQEAFLKVWERWDRVRGLEDPVGYLHRTAFNVFRSRRRRVSVALRKAVRPETPDDATVAIEARIEVARALAELTPMQRAAIVLTDLMDYTSEDAAKMLHMKPGAVRTLASRGRSQMRRDAQGGTEEDDHVD